MPHPEVEFAGCVWTCPESVIKSNDGQMKLSSCAKQLIKEQTVAKDVNVAGQRIFPRQRSGSITTINEELHDNPKLCQSRHTLCYWVTKHKVQRVVWLMYIGPLVSKRLLPTELL